MKTCLCFAIVLLSACSRSNNLLLGRVEATVGTHAVVVTDCYRTSVPSPQRLEDAVYRFTPCRDGRRRTPCLMNSIPAASNAAIIAVRVRP